MASTAAAAAACAVLVLCLTGAAHATYKLQERYNWNQLDFAFPSQTIKDQAIASGDYIPTNGLPVGVEHWGNKLFVTVPRWRDGECARLLIEMSGAPERRRAREMDVGLIVIGSY